MLSLGGGLPSSEYFPFENYSLRVPRIGQFSEAETRKSGVTITAGKHDLKEDKSLFDISTAFNYGQGSGSAQLLRWMTEHTELVHNPPYQDWSCTMTIGSTSGVDMIYRMFGFPNMCMLTEEYSFSTAVEAGLPMGVRSIGVAVDDEGLLAISLDEILSKWKPTERNGSPKPFLLYTVPSGQNPTGATQSLQRRKDIYAVSQKHDLLIIEDEPYYFLQMQPYTGQGTPDPPPPTSHQEFIDSLVPSILSLDVDGRVLRLDSFSKVLAPGSRIGWLTAPTQLCERFRLHSDVSTQGPCGFSQLGIFKLLDEQWGHSGYLDWLVYIRMEYTKRRNVILGACEEFLPPSIVRWKAPMAGMFHWLEVDWTLHPLAGRVKSGEWIMQDLEEHIFQRMIEEKCLLIKGSFFLADRNQALDKLFYRATYAAAPSDRIREAVRRCGVALKSEFGLDGAKSNGVNGHATNGKPMESRANDT